MIVTDLCPFQQQISFCKNSRVVTGTDRAPNIEQVTVAWPRPGQAGPGQTPPFCLQPPLDTFFLPREKIKEMKLTIDISSALQKNEPYSSPVSPPSN